MAVGLCVLVVADDLVLVSVSVSVLVLVEVLVSVTVRLSKFYLNNLFFRLPLKKGNQATD